MPGQLAPAATVQQEIRTYAQRKETAKEKIRQKLGEEVIVRQRNEQVVWKVIAESHADVEKDSGNLGFQGTLPHLLQLRHVRLVCLQKLVWVQASTHRKFQI